MSVFADFSDLFLVDPVAPRMMGYARNPSLIRDDPAKAPAICVELQTRNNFQPSGKFLWLQIEPAHALALAGTILALAKEDNWPVHPNLVDLIETVGLAKKNERN